MKYLIILISVMLNACASYNEGLTKCGRVHGLSCHSLSEVYEKIDNGQITINKNKELKLIPFKRSHIAKNIDYVSYDIDNNRKKEDIVRVWFAPYVDKSGNLIDETMTYMVVDDAKWVRDINWRNYGTVVSQNY